MLCAAIIPEYSYRDVVGQGHDPVSLWDLGVAVSLRGGGLLGAGLGWLPLWPVSTHVISSHGSWWGLSRDSVVIFKVR